MKALQKFRYSKLNSVRYYLTEIFFVLYVFSTILTPNDSLNIKITSFAILILLNIDVIFFDGFSKKNRLIIFFALFYPLFLCFFSLIMFHNNGIYEILSKSYSFFYLLLYFVIKHHNIDFFKYFMQCLSVMACIMCISALLDFLNICDLKYNLLLKWFAESEEAMIRFDRSGTFGYFIYFKASVLLVFPFLYGLSRKSVGKIILYGAALILSGTRANIYLPFFLAVIYMFLYYKSKTFKKLLSFMLAGGGLFLGKKIFLFVLRTFTVKAQNDQIRLGHFSSVFNMFIEHPLTLLFGSGLNAPFYSIGRDATTRLIELSYLDLLRQIGIISFSVFLFFILFPIKKLFEKGQYNWLIFAYISYLIIAGTNPLLTGSTAYIVYNFIYYQAF